MSFKRRRTVEVNVGGVLIGGNEPVKVQSMTNTNTNDIEQSVQQCMRIADAGADIVRLTTQGVREAEHIGDIRNELRARGYSIPLVADVHFNPRAAFTAAERVEKVRINPGNFVDPARTFKSLEYTDEEYKAELQRIHDALVPFLDVCRAHGTAVRLGVNHGSLSDRIMSRYGNTAPGMVESVMEYLRVMVEQKFYNVVISMKASNVVVMVEAVRLLVEAMDAENMHFPLHLGVTEAGFGEDGRIKSAVGIGTLLAEGLGDTIRVSLSEDPEAEVPVARKLVQYITEQKGGAVSTEWGSEKRPAQAVRRNSVAVQGTVGGKFQPVVIASCKPAEVTGAKPDFYYSETTVPADGNKYIVPAAIYSGQANTYPLCSVDKAPTIAAPIKWVQVASDVDVDTLKPLADSTDVVLVLTAAGHDVTGCQQDFFARLAQAGIALPVVLRDSYGDTDNEWLQVKAGVDMGTMLMNGFADGVWLEAPAYGNQAEVVSMVFGALQAARLRTSKTEFISCPSCGRTMFDLQSTVRTVQAATSHLTHLKIAVMGCVVNGPGEMADADYGYVGAAVKRISLYKGKQCIEKNIPEEDAIPRLVALIKANGDWLDP